MKSFAAGRLAPALLQIAALAALVTLGLALCSSSVAARTLIREPGATHASTSAPAFLSNELDAALGLGGTPTFRRGAVVVDLESGETLFSRNGLGSLAPASNEKLPVAFIALSLLGPEFRIQTEALGEGEQSGTEWVGDLVLKGHGDPDLSRADLKTLALRLRASGIRSISGDLIGDESAFDELRTAPGWKSSYLINECAPLSALSVDRGRDTSASPPAVAIREFAAELESAGVTVGGTLRVGVAPDDTIQLASVSSPPLWKLLRFMDRESDNYSAELLLKQIGAVSNEQGTSANGAALVTSALEQAGVPIDGVRIVDGSGLSRLDRLTPAALTALLDIVWSDPALRKPFLSSLSIAGRNGTLEHRLLKPPARNNIYAKTGTTNAASALAGYVRDRYAFAILENGNPVSSTQARAAQDKFVTLLAATSP
jgi:D-alanyl-D-alanine carboxypeptidase/D-alanyl-D-alanine-endopeptidase (penicillin-binding protein 4)